MQKTLQFIFQPLISDPILLFNSNGNMIHSSLSLQHPVFSPHCSHNCPSQKHRIQKTILCSRNKRTRHGFERSTKLALQSAYIIASKSGILPEPLELLLREFGGGNRGGNGGGFRPWNGFGWGAFDGSKKRRKSILGILGILVILGVGLWLVLGKDLVIDGDVFFGSLGLVLFGFSINGWKRGAKDWILGFCCCAVLMGFLCKKENLEGCVRYFRTMKLNRRRKWRVF
ncbi:Hypothetical predicted protein [Olea europaea subsp. europaea]|uniref:Transmembrane protein n=1 Tax=Olea europaea subsp. europaea TaxID=158383 RepID=A0A8S0TMV0_OLEEU|nr:Hypothetical predicted protein [Olea europaea subsp. europaea]